MSKENTKTDTTPEAKALPSSSGSRIPVWSPNRKRFTRVEIQEHIRRFMLLDPQPNGKKLSQREKAENAVMAQIIKEFDEPVFTDEF